MLFHSGQLAGKVDDKTRDILLCCRREKCPKKKGKSYVVLQPNWRHRQIGRRGRKKKNKVPAPKKTPEGSRPNGNEPQGLLCFTGCSSACENLWNKAALNYLSQCPDSTHPLLAVCYYGASGGPKTQVPFKSWKASGLLPARTQTQVATRWRQQAVLHVVRSRRKELVVKSDLLWRVTWFSRRGTTKTILAEHCCVTAL